MKILNPIINAIQGNEGEYSMLPYVENGAIQANEDQYEPPFKREVDINDVSLPFEVRVRKIREDAEREHPYIMIPGTKDEE